MADRQALLLWQVIRLLKNDGYFWLEFTEKSLRNPDENSRIVQSVIKYMYVLPATSLQHYLVSAYCYRLYYLSSVCSTPKKRG